MTDYKLAHTLKELNDYADKGYVFVAVINPDSWLVRKTEPEIELRPMNKEEFEAFTSGKQEPVKKDNEPRTDKKDA